MITHLLSDALCLFEYGEGESLSPEQIQNIISSKLCESELEPWSSMELEALTYRGKTLIFASPVKIYIPSWLLNIV